MAEMTPKERYLGLYQGYVPDSVPSMAPAPGEAPATAMAGPMDLFMGEAAKVFAAAFGGGDGSPPPTSWHDIWGVPYRANAETGYGGLPAPGQFLFSDITKWDKYVKWPSIDTNIDWEARAKADLANIDRSQTAVSAGTGLMPFEQIMAFMGFTEGLCALVEEEESCRELLNYMVDYYEPLIQKMVEYYKPDILGIGDDSASKYAPFFSVSTYKSLFKPIYARLFKPAVDRGIPVDFHNCGKCEAFVPDMVDLGVRYWNPAQTENDLMGIKAKFSNFVICGGWDFVPKAGGVVTEEEIRQSVRDSIDKYAPGGQYVFGGGYLGQADDREKTMEINGWVMDESIKYGKDWYKKH
jgi:hypothetical protein